MLRTYVKYKTRCITNPGVVHKIRDCQRYGSIGNIPKNQMKRCVLCTFLRSSAPGTDMAQYFSKTQCCMNWKHCNAVTDNALEEKYLFLYSYNNN